jgi:hypothetical protein
LNSRVFWVFFLLFFGIIVVVNNPGRKSYQVATFEVEQKSATHQVFQMAVGLSSISGLHCKTVVASLRLMLSVRSVTGLIWQLICCLLQL